MPLMHCFTSRGFADLTCSATSFILSRLSRLAIFAQVMHVPMACICRRSLLDVLPDWKNILGCLGWWSEATGIGALDMLPHWHYLSRDGHETACQLSQCCTVVVPGLCLRVTYTMGGYSTLLPQKCIYCIHAYTANDNIIQLRRVCILSWSTFPAAHTHLDPRLHPRQKEVFQKITTTGIPIRHLTLDCSIRLPYEVSDDSSGDAYGKSFVSKI